MACHSIKGGLSIFKHNLDLFRWQSLVKAAAILIFKSEEYDNKRTSTESV
jgi:hypothetical protein